jgi:hypothetical protein
MPPNLDAVRTSVLDRMERDTRRVKLAVIGAALVESLMLGLALWQIDFSNRFERSVFLLFILSYTVVALGLLALGAHVSRVGHRVLAALEPSERT